MLLVVMRVVVVVTHVHGVVVVVSVGRETEQNLN
jgi:hypothetical protein